MGRVSVWNTFLSTNAGEGGEVEDEEEERDTAVVVVALSLSSTAVEKRDGAFGDERDEEVLPRIWKGGATTTKAQHDDPIREDDDVASAAAIMTHCGQRILGVW